MKKLFAISLLCIAVASAFAQTQVLFPINSLFGGAAYNKPLTITAANTLISDGQNLWAGTYTILPASTTNRIASLYPNTYLLTIPGVVKPLRFTVPASTNVLDVTTLLTSGPLFYFGTNGFANLIAGAGVQIATNADGSITFTSGGDGSGFTNIPGAAIAGPISLASVPYPTVTNQTFLSPMMFGAVGDGASDDMAALQAMVAAYNAGPIRTIDLQGKSYFLTSGPLRLLYGRGVVKNGTIICPSNYLGAVFIRSTTNGFFASAVTFQNLNIWRQGTNAPDTSGSAIQTGDYNTGYSTDVTVQNCCLSNFWVGVRVINSPQVSILHNDIRIAWSNCVCIDSPLSAPGTTGEGADESVIAVNDFNPGDSRSSPQCQYITNHLVVLQLNGYCTHLDFNRNNVGAFKQAIKTSPLCGSWISISGEFEGFMGIGGPGEKFPLFELWNSKISLMGFSAPTTFGVTPNYSALFGAYATNGGHLNFGQWDLIGNGSLGQFSPLFDIWSADGPWNPIDGYALPRIRTFNGGTLVLHTNWGDTGLTISPNFGTTFSTYDPVGSGTNVSWPLVGRLYMPDGSIFHNEPGVGQWFELNNAAIFDNGATFLNPPSSYQYLDRGGGSLSVWSKYSGDWRLVSDKANVNDFDMRGTGTNIFVPVPMFSTNALNVDVGTQWYPTNLAKPVPPVSLPGASCTWSSNNWLYWITAQHPNGVLISPP